MITKKEIAEGLAHKEVCKEIDHGFNLNISKDFQKIDLFEPYQYRIRSKFEFRFGYEKVHDRRYVGHIEREATNAIFMYLYSELIHRLSKLRAEIQYGIPAHEADRQLKEILDVLG